MVNFS